MSTKPTKSSKPRAAKKAARVEVAPEDTEMSKDLTQYVPTKQAASMMGVTSPQVRHLLIIEKIRGMKFGPDWLVYVPSIRRYLETKSTKGRPSSREPELQATE